MGAVKTTIEIPDALFRKAKSKAAESGQTLKDLVTQGIAGETREQCDQGPIHRARMDEGSRKAAATAQRNEAHPGED
jgi:hypothetical protein